MKSEVIFLFCALCFLNTTSFAEKELQVIEFTENSTLLDYNQYLFSFIPSSEDIDTENWSYSKYYREIYHYVYQETKYDNLIDGFYGPYKPFGEHSKSIQTMLEEDLDHYDVFSFFFSFLTDGIKFKSINNAEMFFATVYNKGWSIGLLNTSSGVDVRSTIYFLVALELKENRSDSLWISTCYNDTTCNLTFPLNKSDFIEIEKLTEHYLLELEDNIDAYDYVVRWDWGDGDSIWDEGDNEIDSLIYDQLYAHIFRRNKNTSSSLPFIYQKDSSYLALCNFDIGSTHTKFKVDAYGNPIEDIEIIYNDMKLGCFITDEGWDSFDSLPVLMNDTNKEYADSYPYYYIQHETPEAIIPNKVQMKKNVFPKYIQINGRKASNKNASGVYVSKDGAKVELKK